MPIRWYISPYAGDGSRDNAFHAAAWDHVDPERDHCDGPFSPQRQHYLARVNAPQSVHDAIISNNAGLPVSLLYADRSAEVTALSSPFTSATEIANMESSGYPMHWINSNTTLKQMLRGITRMIFASQSIHKVRIANRLFQLELSATVANLTSQQRNAVRDWMASKSLAVGWISASTTIREVLRYIVVNLTHGNYRIRSEEF